MFTIFDLSLQLNGFPIHKAKEKLEAILAVPEEDYGAFLDLRKKTIAAYHLQNNAFYKNLVGKERFENWEDLPIMTKQDYQRPLKERLSNGYTLKNVFTNKTSGSSGNPMVFAKDKFCHALVWANIMRRFGWHGIDFNHSLQARFYGMPLDYVANKIVRLKDFLSNRYRFTIFDLSDQKIKKIIGVFGKKKFGYINGYTSNIVLIAKYLKTNNLVLKEICPTLKVCVVTSEMLFEEDKVLLEKQLGVPVINEYGASELDIIAFQNQKNEWMVNTETLFVEILDENNKPLPYGKEGRIVVTSLDNKAHPFIRYDVGDFGILDEKSTVKKPLLKKLIGRTSDFAILPSGKKAAGMTFYSITKKLFDDNGKVKEFTIKQTNYDTFEIEYSSESSLTEVEIFAIKNVFSKYLEDHLNYIFIRKDSISRSKSGKLKQFVSLVK